MNKILVAGLITIETTLNVGEFPVQYAPVDYRFFSIGSTVSGVGYNVTKAIKKLGAEPKLLSVIGQDIYKGLIFSELEKEAIDVSHIIPMMKETSQSVILYDNDGRRKINLDLKNIQDLAYPSEDTKGVFNDVDIAVICNINFARNLLPEAKRLGIPVATDVHVVDDINDEYNKDFMANADILFLSNEKIQGKEQAFIEELKAAYHNAIIVVGMGSKGALIYVRADDTLKVFPVVHTRNIVSTIGAGDALFSAFIYFYTKSHDPYAAIENATIFASYKIGEKGGASGFLDEQQFIELKERLGK